MTKHPQSPTFFSLRAPPGGCRWGGGVWEGKKNWKLTVQVCKHGSSPTQSRWLPTGLLCTVIAQRKGEDLCSKMPSFGAKLLHSIGTKPKAEVYLQGGIGHVQTLGGLDAGRMELNGGRGLQNWSLCMVGLCKDKADARS